MLCGFSTSLVGVGGVRLMGEVLLLEGGQFPVLALLEAQLCLGRSRVGRSGNFSIAFPCDFPVFLVGCCGCCCGCVRNIVYLYKIFSPVFVF